jgi:hypothetical protein
VRALLDERVLADLSISELDAIRRVLFQMEDRYRREDDLEG